MASKEQASPARKRRRNKMAPGLVAFFRNHVQPKLPEPTFIMWHYLYFTATCLLASIVFWGSSTPSKSVRYIDSLFLCVSAMTEAGLNTVNLSELNTWQQVMLFLLIIMGSAIFVSIAILHVRKRAFERKFSQLVEERRNRWRKRRTRTLTWSWSRSVRRPSSASADHDAAVASGAVRGRSIPEPIEDADAMGPTRSYKLPEHRSRSRSNDRQDRRRRQNALDRDGDGVDLADQNGHIRFPDRLATTERLDPPRQTQNQAPTRAQPPAVRRRKTSFFEGRGVGARGLDNHPRHARPRDFAFAPSDEFAIDDSPDPPIHQSSKINKYIDTVNGYLGRNSQFHQLSDKERRHLGGIEYDAICMLSWVVPLYFFLFQLLGALGVGAWIQATRPGTAYRNGLSPFWTGMFFAVSAFNNSGMALLDANATAFQTSYYVLLTLSLLILAGNTCFPPFLRLILWTMKVMVPRDSDSKIWQRRRRTLEFCLDHPRRVYTNLFPSEQNWWLVFSLVVLNGVDWVAFELLNIGNPVTQAIAPHFRVLDGLFQAFAVRSGGFYVVDIAGLRSGLLVLYVAMMYISAIPVAVTIRSTNVYEERSLGIYAEELEEQRAHHDEEAAQAEKPENSTPRKLWSGLRRTMTMTHGQGGGGGGGGQDDARKSTWTRQDFVRQQLRGQLGHDLWWIALAIFLIVSIETGQFERDPVVFSTFNVIFETVSAYGCVGISTGVPWAAYSFSGTWHTASKLVLCAVMLRGRHRGLPVSIDRAVLLPDESLAWAEEEDASNRRPSFGGGGASRAVSRDGPPPGSTASRASFGPGLGGPGPSVPSEDGTDGDKDAGHMA